MPLVPRTVCSLGLGVAMLPLAGCDPLVNIEGAFFPAWLVAGVSGVIAMVLTWSILRKMGVDQFLWARPFTYICLLVMYTCLTWLVLYAN